MPERYVITGASGKLGRRTAELALQRCPPERADPRDPEPGRARRSSRPRRRCALRRFLGARKPLGRIRRGDPAVAREHDGSRAPRRATSRRDRGRRCGRCGQLIYTSIVSPEPPNPAVVAPSHYARNARSRKAGRRLPCCATACTRTSRCRRPCAHSKRERSRTTADGPHRIRHSRGLRRGRRRRADERRSRGSRVRRDGPETCTANELAELYADLGDREVKPIELADAEFVARLVGSSDRDAHMRYGAELVASFGRAMRDGYFASCTQTVEQITGRPPRALRAVLAAGLRSAREKA